VQQSRDVPRLVEASREAGVVVRVHDTVSDIAAVPDLVGRTAYRVVQEGLTNVHKHAPGAAAAIRLGVAPDGDLEVEVRNARAVGGRSVAPLPGSGMGLVGLRERVELAGGRLDAGHDPEGGFVVRARLPWPGEKEERNG
jgi:signal transduction histidine kinase